MDDPKLKDIKVLWDIIKAITPEYLEEWNKKNSNEPEENR